MTSRTAGTLVALCAVALSSCGDDGSAGPSLNGCNNANYVDRTAATASRTIQFGGFGGSPSLGYAPSCMIVSAGQTVTFAGGPSGFSTHPLSPGSSPSMRAAGSANNPITRTDDSRETLAVTFATAGDYPYFCEYHYGGGMLGVVRVR